jgi:hypothetical protein
LPNPGDIPAPFVVAKSAASGTLTVGDTSITLTEAVTDLEWDSKTGMVTGLVNSVRRPIYYVGQGMCTIPLNTKQDAHFIEPRKY